jgi:small-conductance mechanosensitive channel
MARLRSARGFSAMEPAPAECDSGKAMDLLTNPRVQFAVSLLVITALFVFVVRRVLKRRSRGLHAAAPDEERHLLADLVHRAIGPVTLLLWYYGAYVAAHVAISGGWLPDSWQWLDTTLRHVASLGIFVSFLWFFFRVTDLIETKLAAVAARTAGRVDDVLLPLFGTALRVTVPILAFFLLLRLWPLPPQGLAVIQKLLGVALVAGLAWVVRRAVVLTDAAILGPKGLTGQSTAEQRALYTRVRMLRRIALVLVGAFAFAAVLMMFDEVRDIGRSIFASAGIAGIVLGFAAQRTLGNLFAGIQIAITQPVRLGDQVIVEGDFATIEEIILIYVVARTWDARRIVLPIGYFIEKPFQNWTRSPTSMLSPLTLRVDFSLPVDELRRYMEQEIAKSTLWDKAVFGVQVTDSNDRSMEVRVLASAVDSGAAFNLRCELREKAIDFIHRNYPQCLPKLRQDERQVETWRATTGLDDGHGPFVTPAKDAAVPPSRRG